MKNFGVIFDSDGVIVDSEKHSLKAFVKAIEENGIHLSDEDILSNCGLTDADIIEYMKQKFGKSLDLAKFQSRKKELYKQFVDQDTLDIFPGVKELLQTLTDEQIPFCLASSGSMEKITYNLTRTGVIDFFKIMITGEDFEKGKPDPAIFLAAAKRLGLSTDACVVIEDSVNGIKAAKNAGIKCIAVEHTFTHDKLNEADLILKEIKDMTVPMITKLIGK